MHQKGWGTTELRRVHKVERRKF